MLKYSLAATSLLVVGLTACLDDPAGPECSPVANNVVETRGDTTVTSSGLKYIETEVGVTGQEARWCAAVQIEYVGSFLDGTQFDAGPLAFRPGELRYIPGFEMGVIGMKIDGNRRLIIPPSLAYGAQGLVHPQTGEVIIPANTTVVFDVELIATQ